ncbi:hypothetical protein acdb102_02100 [Acidothermaceae bacterium B102]|nr:hypothetical protein acdb102_02100 [Acidothermaceae bacterium B102]
MRRRPPSWRLALLVVLLVVIAVIGFRRLPHHPNRTLVGLGGHSGLIGGTLPAGSSWPEAMHDAGHSGTAAVRGPQTGRVRWTRKLIGSATPGPVVTADGDILAATNDGVLHALDARTGADLWTFDSGNRNGTDLSVSPAVLPSGVIVWPAPGNSLLGLSPTGRLLWRLSLHGGPTSPAIAADGVVIGDSAGWIYAIRVPVAGPATITWSLAVGTGSYGSVALGRGVIFQSVTDGVVALSADGHLRWRRSLPAPVEVSPAATSDGGVVVGAGGTMEYGLDGSGHVRWQHDRRAETYSSPVVTSDGLTAFGDHAGIVTVLDAVTGHLEARYPLLGHRQYPRTIGIWSSPVVDRDHDLYVASFQGHVQGFAADGRRLFDLDTGVAVDSYPAMTADGGLVVAGADGTVRLIADS